jgi:maltose phosphorylase
MAKIVDRYFLVDPWKVIEKGFDPSHGRVAESIFSVANEFMGVRGYFEEGYSGDTLHGSYLNAVYATSVDVQFNYKGLVSRDCFVVNSVDWLYTRIFLDGEKLDLANVTFHDFKREIDMKTGVMSREFIWELSNGKRLKMVFLRFVSMDSHNVGCQRIIIEPLNFKGTITIQSCLDFSTIYEMTGKNYWSCLRKEYIDNGAAILALTEDSGQQAFSSFRLDVENPIEMRQIEDEKLIGVEFELSVEQEQAVTIEKIVCNHAERKSGINPDDVWEQGQKLANEHLISSYNDYLEKQINFWIAAWDMIDIKVEGDPENQQGVRFCVFSLYQTKHGADNTLNVGGKGLTGESYGGKTWWDTESYILPFYLFTNPKAARDLILYRYHHLPAALERAIEMDCLGACYPMSTIDGTECCNWWWHGNLEIHVSAAIPYGIWHYVHVTNDKELLYNQGIEMLLQSSRYFASRGQWSPSGEFGFYGVMGADEFHMMVNNNFYTNIMAKKTFEYTLEVIDEMRRHAPFELSRVVDKVELHESEIVQWREMASKIILLFDEKTGIYEQHEGFFDLPHTDYKTIPHTDYPLYHNWSYDRIFRTDITKQPDSLLPLFFFSQEYTLETKRVNYDYYEPRCCHDSSLSPCIHAIFASELGYHDKAHEYAKFASRIDLDDYNRNAREGLHIPALAGAWLTFVYGFGGLRADGQTLTFNPSMPKNWESFSFNIMYKNTRLNIRINRNSVHLRTFADITIPVVVFGKEYSLDKRGLEIDMPVDRLRTTSASGGCNSYVRDDI